MRVIVAGAADWTDGEAIARELARLPPGTTVIHGDAPGADALAGAVAARLGFRVEPMARNREDYAGDRRGAWKGSTSGCWRARPCWSWRSTPTWPEAGGPGTWSNWPGRRESRCVASGRSGTGQGRQPRTCCSLAASAPAGSATA